NGAALGRPGPSNGPMPEMDDSGIFFEERRKFLKKTRGDGRLRLSQAAGYEASVETPRGKEDDLPAAVRAPMEAHCPCRLLEEALTVDAGLADVPALRDQRPILHVGQAVGPDADADVHADHLGQNTADHVAALDRGLARGHESGLASEAGEGGRQISVREGLGERTGHVIRSVLRVGRDGGRWSGR